MTAVWEGQCRRLLWLGWEARRRRLLQSRRELLWHWIVLVSFDF